MIYSVLDYRHIFLPEVDAKMTEADAWKFSRMRLMKRDARIVPGESSQTSNCLQFPRSTNEIYTHKNVESFLSPGPGEIPEFLLKHDVFTFIKIMSQ